MLPNKGSYIKRKGSSSNQLASGDMLVLGGVNVDTISWGAGRATQTVEKYWKMVRRETFFPQATGSKKRVNHLKEGIWNGFERHENHLKEGIWNGFERHEDIWKPPQRRSLERYSCYVAIIFHCFQLQLGSHGPFVELDPTDMTSPTTIPPEQPSQIPPGQWNKYLQHQPHNVAQAAIRRPWWHGRRWRRLFWHGWRQGKKQSA